MNMIKQLKMVEDKLVKQLVKAALERATKRAATLLSMPQEQGRRVKKVIHTGIMSKVRQVILETPGVFDTAKILNKTGTHYHNVRDCIKVLLKQGKVKMVSPKNVRPLRYKVER